MTQNNFVIIFISSGLISFRIDKGGSKCDRLRLSVKNAWMDLDKILRVAVGAWTKPDPDHSPDPGGGFTPDFWILTGYLKKLWTDFEEILCVDSCWNLHELVMFRAGFGSEFGSWSQWFSWIRTCIQNCKVDSANSNGRISVKFYEWRACESRKTAFNFGSDTNHIGFWRNLVQRWRLLHEEPSKL